MLEAARARGRAAHDGVHVSLRAGDAVHASPRHQRRHRHAVALPRAALPGLGPPRHRLAPAARPGRLGRDRRHAVASARLRALPRRPDAARHRDDVAGLADSRVDDQGVEQPSGHRRLGGLPGRVRQRRHRRVREREDGNRLCRRRHQPRLLRGERQRRRGRSTSCRIPCASCARTKDGNYVEEAVPAEFRKIAGSPRDGDADPWQGFRYDQDFEFIEAIHAQRAVPAVVCRRPAGAGRDVGDSDVGVRTSRGGARRGMPRG